MSYNTGSEASKQILLAFTKRVQILKCLVYSDLMREIDQGYDFLECTKREGREEEDDVPRQV